MSPHLRNLLEEAADDGGRPVGLDLAAVRSAGRRATWRQRVIVGGGAVGAAAVITSVALVLAPGGAGSGFQPAGPGTSESPPSWEDAVRPLVAVIEANGYVVTPGYMHSASSASESSTGSTESLITASTMRVANGEAAGAVTAGEFNDVSAVMDLVLGDVDPPPLTSEVDGYDHSEQCAVLPVNVHRADFAWDTCEESPDGRQRVATGGDTYGEAIGVTVLRPDGSGVSVAVSTASFDRPVGGGEPATPTLDGLPVTADELLAAAELMLEIGPAVPAPEQGVATASPPTALPPTELPPTAVAEAPPSDFPCPGDAPPPECLPMDGAFVEVGPLVDALLDKGLEVVTMSESVGESSDSSASSTVLQFAVTDRAGRMGSAAIGVYDDLESARQAGAGTTEAASWCAVPPVERPEFAWSVAGDGPACTGLEHSGVAQMLGFYHLEDAGDAVGATLVRSDGSVISVSVGQAPAAEISSDATPLAAAPLNVADLLDLLALLDAANPVS